MKSSLHFKIFITVVAVWNLFAAGLFLISYGVIATYNPDASLGYVFPWILGVTLSAMAGALSFAAIRIRNAAWAAALIMGLLSFGWLIFAASRGQVGVISPIDQVLSLIIFGLLVSVLVTSRAPNAHKVSSGV